MLSMFSMFGVLRWFRGSLLAQIATGLVVFLGVWKVNNSYVASATKTKIVQASKKAGKKRNAQVRKIRKSIKPSTALERLRLEYAESD